jgi:cbb3-type cytochrome oxidase maturation protein
MLAQHSLRPHPSSFILAFMEILYLLIPLSVALAFLIGGLFWWSVKSGQFDDLEGPAHRVLDDDDTDTPEGR